MPTTKVWTIDEDSKVKAKRTGFLGTPDFCRTAHNEQGASETAAIVDCLEVQHTSKLGDQLASYVGVSRIKTKSGLLVMQPFSPGLFAHGPPPGPHILMRLLRGELSVSDVDDEFERMEREKKEAGAERSLLKMLWECKACRLMGEEAYMKPMEDFGVQSAFHFTHKLLPQGAWARCSRCSRQRKGKLGAQFGELGAFRP